MMMSIKKKKRQIRKAGQLIQKKCENRIGFGRNIEIKAKITRFDQIKRLVAELSGKPPLVLNQEDIYYKVSKGRLKLRIERHARSELIYYERRDDAAPKSSVYIRTAVPKPLEMKRFLSAALGELGRIRKKRLLYLIGATRVHLDKVEGLGAFIELEVVLRRGESEKKGQRIALNLLDALRIDKRDLIKGSYADLSAGRSWRGRNLHG